MYKGVEIIAEVKTMSPFGFKSTRSWNSLLYVAHSIGDIISIHSDIRWGGSLDHIKRARQLTSKDILAKGIHENDDELTYVFDSGANYALVVGRISKSYDHRYCFIEPNNLEQLSKIPREYRVVWNSRDLITGNPKKETFQEARKLWKGWLCQASYIRNVKDIKPGADAVLVGEYLEEFKDSLS